MVTENQLKEKGFQEIINESGAYVLEFSITDDIKVRTWGNTEEGNVLGAYLYKKSSDKYGEALPLE